MESGAQGGAGQATAGGDGAAGGEAEAASAGGAMTQEQASELMAQFGSMSEGQEELRNLVASLAGNEDGDLTGDGEDGDLFDFGQFVTDDGTGEPTIDPEAFNQTFQQAVDKAVEQRVNPLQQNVQEMARANEMRELVTEFPDLGDPEFVTQVAGVTAQVAQSIGHPELAQEPGFLRLVYLAGNATDAANAEGGDDPRVATLEGGSGASAGGVTQADLGDQIVSQTGAKRGLPFG